MSEPIKLPTGITKKAINSAVLDAIVSGSAVILWDVAVRGFFARVGPPNDKYPTGKITFGVHKRQGGRKSRAIALMFGSYPDMDIGEARDKAIGLIAQIVRGENPSLEKKSLFARRREEYKQFKTSKFSIVYETYRKARIEEKGESQYYTKQMPNNFNRHVLPHIGQRALQEITRDDLRSLLDNIPTLPMRRVVHAQLSPIFDYAIEKDIITTNPFDGIKLPAASQPRDRVLNKAEIKAFWQATQDIINSPKPIYGHFFRALLLSAARLNEIARLEFSEIDADERLITIPASRMKMRKPHVIPITGMLSAVIEAAPKKHDKFVYSYGRDVITSFSKSKSVLDERMERHLGGSLEPFVLHCLRHTFSTTMAGRGCNLDHIELCLAHDILKGSQKHYNHYAFIKEKRVVLEAWESYIKECVG